MEWLNDDVRLQNLFCFNERFVFLMLFIFLILIGFSHCLTFEKILLSKLWALFTKSFG